MNNHTSPDVINFEIDVRGEIDPSRLESLRDDLELTATTMSVTVLRGSAPDQAALLRVLESLQSAGLDVAGVRRLPPAFVTGQESP